MGLRRDRKQPNQLMLETMDSLDESATAALVPSTRVLTEAEIPDHLPELRLVHAARYDSYTWYK